MHDVAPCILIFTRHALPLARRIAEAFRGDARIVAPLKAFAPLAPMEQTASGCASKPAGEREDLEGEEGPHGHASIPIAFEEDGVELYETQSSQLVGSLLQAGCPLIAVASVGLMVRLVARHLQGKAVDPPVVVVDEGGRFVVPVLSGHLGGGNALAERIAAYLGAVPVVTTATEALGTLPIDRVAAEEGWRIEDVATVKPVARSLVNGEPVVVVQECGETGWRQRFAPLPPSIDFLPGWKAIPEGKAYAGGVLISDRIFPEEALRAVAPAWVVCRPLSLVIGVGAEKGVPPDDLETAVWDVLHMFGLTPHSVAAVATLDRKAAEEGFRAWLAQRGWPTVTYTAEALARVPGIPNPSEVVAQAVGTPGVCEPAALLAAGCRELLVTKQKRGRVTVAVARKTSARVPLPSADLSMGAGMSPEPLSTELHPFAPACLPTPHGSSPTEAVHSQPPPPVGEVHSQSPPPTGEVHSQSPLPPGEGQGEGKRHPAPQARGRLTVVGIGPGAPDLLTLRAVEALERADIVIGYERYIQLLGDRVAGKDLRTSPIGQEMDRVRLAIELARDGREVALVSSGDAGIYGMGGLVFEQLAQPGSNHSQQGGRPGDLRVEVVPGVTAAQSAASLLGAPLANDFAVLSLSDLLTPRTVIERRLQAVAAADIVIALYNPQSQRRRELFQEACQILLRHRPGNTPVAVVRAAHRDGQAIHLGALAQLHAMPVDMESLVLIGNSQTRRWEDHLVTTRGYIKEEVSGVTGQVSSEEKYVSRATGHGSSVETHGLDATGYAAEDRGDVAELAEPENAAEASRGTVATGELARKVWFVGAGPGDPELLTLRGARALATADVVVYAGSLVPRGVLAHVRRGARIHNSAALTLEDTHRLLTDAYRAGQRVVRLHSGDPSLYGAITEQMALLDREGIPHEIVPGVSAFQAVAARLGMEYTLPGVVQTLILTRAGGRTGLPPNESLADLARHGVTLCLFLSARHVGEVQETLLASYAPTTPVAVAYRATWPDEELVLGTLAELVEIVQSRGYERTALIVVGPSLQRQGARSRLYDPSHWHLFRPERRQARP